eukprot:scaffold94822_cov25-Tisochrysis_lutea.AAC.1
MEERAAQLGAEWLEWPRIRLHPVGRICRLHLLGRLPLGVGRRAVALDRSFRTGAGWRRRKRHDSAAAAACACLGLRRQRQLASWAAHGAHAAWAKAKSHLPPRLIARPGGERVARGLKRSRNRVVASMPGPRGGAPRARCRRRRRNVAFIKNLLHSTCARAWGGRRAAAERGD